MLAITRSTGKLIATVGAMGIGYLYRRRRSVHRFSRTLRQMGMAENEITFLTSGYRDMVSLPSFRQLARSRGA